MRRLPVICVLLATAGCFRSYRDISDSPEVAETRLIGKAYELTRDLIIIKYKDDRFELAVSQIQHEKFTHLGTLPRGTIVKITQVVLETIPLATSYRHPFAVVQNGPLTGRKFSMRDEFGTAFAFDSLTPHPSRPVSQTSLTAWLADIHDPDPAIRYWAARYLGGLSSPLSSEVTHTLIQATTDADPEVRLQAVIGLRRVPPTDLAVVCALIAVMERRDDYSIHRAASQLLVSIGPTALPEVARCLHSKDPRWAIMTLRDFGPTARPYLPELAALIRDHRALSLEVVDTMREIDAPASAELLLPMAHDPKTREQAIVALGGLASNHYKRIPPGDLLNQLLSVFTQALDDPVEDIRRAALDSLNSRARLRAAVSA